MSLDPIGLAGGTNSYQYAPNPSGWADPLGLSKQQCSCGGENRSAAPALKTYSEMNFPDGNLKFTDAMTDKAFSKMMKDVEANGFTNPVVKYVEVRGKDYIAVGNNRVMVAERLGMKDALRFEKVEFPVPNTSWKTPQDIWDASGTVKVPKRR